MKAVVLSGGQGTRLRPISHSVPKQLVPVGGRSVLAHVIADIVAAGITEVVVVVSPESKAPVETLMTSLDVPNLEVDIAVQPTPNGLAAALGVAAPFAGGAPVLLYLGDCLITGGIGHVIAEHDSAGADATILVAEVDDPSRYGIVEVGDNGHITRLVEKPKEPTSNLAVVGVYAFGAGIWDALDRVEPSWRGEYEITDALQLLVDGGGVVQPSRLRGWWMDTGTIEDVFVASSRLLAELQPADGADLSGNRIDGVVVVDPTASVRDSHLIGPVVVGPGTTIVGSVVGPDTTLGRGVEVADATLERSIVMDHAVVGSSTLTRSFLGPRAVVKGVGQPLSVVVGADAVVSLDDANHPG